MIRKLKIFREKYTSDLQIAVNKFFLENTNIKVMDINSYHADGYHFYIITYKDESS